MSKKVSKLSRKCANKNTHRLNINNLDKSSDDFEDDARPFTRNSVKIINKNRNTSSKKVAGKDGLSSIYSVCNKLSANKSDTKMCNNENVPNKITKEKTITEENCTNGKIISVSAITQGAHPITLNNIVAHLEPHEDSNYGTAKILDTDTTKEVQDKLTRVSEEPQLIAEGNFKLPPCRLCGKYFKNNHEAKRIAHLKECGALLGVGAGDLVKLRRLEVNKI
jgi:hypothetical protein